jgi:purine-nucleoside phosphorylase
MTTHIGAKPGDIAETVLLPGDPYRARWAAQTFLKDAVLVNEVRGMLGFTGTWNGHRVTIHGSGMGMPSLSIYANELIRDYGAKTLIRIGSAGALPTDVKVRDVILAQTASTVGSPSRSIFKELNFAPCADFGFCQRLTLRRPPREPLSMSAGSTRRTPFTTNAPTFQSSSCGTVAWASRWKRPSFTSLPPATRCAPWPS